MADLTVNGFAGVPGTPGLPPGGRGGAGGTGGAGGAGGIASAIAVASDRRVTATLTLSAPAVSAAMPA